MPYHPHRCSCSSPSASKSALHTYFGTCFICGQWKDELETKTNNIFKVHIHHGKDKLKVKITRTLHSPKLIHFFLKKLFQVASYDVCSDTLLSNGKESPTPPYTGCYNFLSDSLYRFSYPQRRRVSRRSPVA